MPVQLSNNKLNQNQNHTSLYFWLFVFIHTLLWTVGPSLARLSVPHDTLEGISWGLQWQLGYHKHPFLTAWLCAGITELFGTVGWPVYLLAQLAVSATFVAVWQLAKEILPEKQALIASLVLEGVLFYNINSFNITPDTLQSPLWAFLSLFLYRAITSQKIGYWLATGFFAALCLCTKYQIVILFIPMLLLCLLNPLARSSFKKPGIYWAIAFFILLIMPHLIWLYQHQFITLVYAKHISGEYTPNKTIFDHLNYPVRLLINAGIDVVGVSLLLWPFYNKNKEPILLKAFQWQFLIAIGTGPLVLTFLLCAISGDYFPPRWSTPYFFLIGVIIMSLLQPALTQKNLRQFSYTLILFSLLLFLGRMSTLTILPRAESDAFLPNKAIALSLEKLWHERYNEKLRYVAGSNYLVALVSPYMTDKPKPYFNWLPNESPWVDERSLRKHGGLFIWDEGRNYTWDNDSQMHAHVPQEIFNRFSELQVLPSAIFYRSSDKHPVLIGIALLPPSALLRKKNENPRH